MGEGPRFASDAAVRSVCFVSTTARNERPALDPSTRYRCYHVAEALGNLGYRCTVTSLATFLGSPTYAHDAYIFHRPAFSAKFASIVADLHRLGKRLIADYDDLIFGGAEEAIASSIVKNGHLTEEQGIALFARNLEALRLFDVFTTSTKPLCQEVKRFKPDARVEVVPNALPPSLVEFVDGAKLYERQRLPKRIGYFAGSKSHDRDFPIAEAAVRQVLSDDSSSSFIVVGPVELPGSLREHPRVEQYEVVDFLQLPAVMTQCSEVIAPLETSVFNDCKSRVKWLEAAAAGCRLIATPIPDMIEAAGGWTGLPRSADEWASELSVRFESDARRERARAQFLELRGRCSIAVSTRPLLGILSGA